MEVALRVSALLVFTSCLVQNHAVSLDPEHSYKSNLDESDDSCVVSAAHLDHRVESLAASSTSLQMAIERLGSLESVTRMLESGSKPGQSWSSSAESVNWKPESKCNEDLAPILETCEIANNQTENLRVLLREVLQKQNQIISDMASVKSDGEQIAVAIEKMNSGETKGVIVEPECCKNSNMAADPYFGVKGVSWEMQSKLDQILEHLKAVHRCHRVATLTMKSLRNGNKFLFTNEKMDWNEAKECCEKLGLHLAVMDTEEKIKEISLQFQPKTDWLHTSGTDKNQLAGEFSWRNGKKVMVGLFKKGDPNDFKEGQETCVFVKDSKLWDYSCAYKTYAICEAPTDCL